MTHNQRGQIDACRQQYRELLKALEKMPGATVKLASIDERVTESVEMVIYVVVEIKD